ncbi:class I SAM-dependent methyltransferase [Thermodesulfobacteriota bacterium]
MTEAIAPKTDPGHVCPHRFAFMLDNWGRRLLQNPKKVVGEYIKEGDTVMDIGCGPGFFSIDMAQMVGAEGKVIAADLQAHMLSKVRKKAERHGLVERMEFHQCQPNAIGFNRKVDFILAYYMVHETPDPGKFFCETKSMLRSGSGLLVVEPRIHVSQKAFDAMVTDGEMAGLKPVGFPKGKGGRSVFFRG